MSPVKEKSSPGTRADQRRQHLLGVARALFVQQGFHQTGIAQIASESGIKVGQMYRDFESKEAIIAAICESDVEAWLEEELLAAAVSKGDLEAIRAWVKRFGDQDASLDKCRVMTEIIAEAGRNPRVADIFQRVDARVRASLSAALTALAPKGAPADDTQKVVELILTLGAGSVCRRIGYPQRSDELIRRVVNAAITRELDPLFAGGGSKKG